MSQSPQPAKDPLAHSHDIEVEKAVLAVLLDGRHLEAYSILAEICPDLDSFYQHHHQIVALAIHEVAATGERVSAQVVGNHLATMPFEEAKFKVTPLEERRSPHQPRARLAQGQYEASALAMIGGLNAISDLSTVFSPVASHRRNCEQLARYLRQRRAIKAVQIAQARLLAPDGSNQVEAVIADVGNALNVALGKGKLSCSVHGGMAENLIDHDRAAELRASGMAQRVASWGVDALDELCPLRAGRYVILAAHPGGGKTSLMLQAAQATRATHGGQAVRIIEWDVMTTDLSMTLMARSAGIARSAMEKGWMTPEQRERYIEAQASWAKDDIQTMGEGENTRLADVVAWIRLQHRQSAGKMLLVLIDYLQLLPGTGRPGQSEYDIITAASAAMVKLKNQLGICIVALSQFNSGLEKEKRKPRLGDLHGSGRIGKDADAVIFLVPTGEKGDSQNVEAIAEKNRGYPTGMTNLVFQRREGQVFRPPLPVGEPDEPDEHSSGRTRHDRMYGHPTEGASHAFDQ